ncbi:MAG TPA: hypothetical protein VFR37_08000 [Longimicrobium sp.]|nr:hypothetical protein [Longimicrobium sp.]
MDELTRDPGLARALAGLDAEPPAVEWDALRARVAAQAELPLARRRRARTLHRGMRALVPLAAAGIAAITLTSRHEAEAALSPEEQAVVDEILSLSVPDQVDLLITGQAAEQAMLEVAAGEGTGGRE